MCRTIPGICMSLLSPLICFLYVQKIRSEIKVMIEYTSTKNIKILVIFFYKRWWRDMHIVHVFVWNLMIGHVFFSTNLTLPGNLLHPYYCHCRKPQQGNYRQLKKKQQIHMY